MSRATPDVAGRLEFGRRAAREAGRRILRYYGQQEHELKAGGSPVTAADLESNAYLVSAIEEAYPGEVVLAEESAVPESRDSEWLWVVDPLDGTREFLSQNGEFAVMLGLVHEGAPVLGVVYLPARGLLYSAASGHGSWVETEHGTRHRLRCEPADLSRLRLVGSRSHPDPLLQEMQRALGITDVRPSGSVGVKCALIAEGQRDLYVHPVPWLKEWDTCAPEAVLREAGGRVTDCLGAPLRYGQAVPVQAHGIVASAGNVHDDVLRVIVPLYEAALQRGRGSGERTERGTA